MHQPEIFLYAEGTSQLGAGHLVRARALAEEAEHAGAGLTLVTRRQPTSQHHWAWAGLPARELDAADAASAVAQLTAQREGHGALIIDHPQVAIPPGAIVIEDVVGRSLTGARMVINPWATPADYPHLVTCTGPAYALLRSAFSPDPQAKRDHRVLVLLGATDHRGLQPAVLAAMAAAGKEAVTIGSTPVSATALAELMRACGSGILSCSGVACEADACGMPVVVLRTAPDQQRLAECLTATGISVITAEAPNWLESVLVANPRHAGLFDGGGAARVAARIRESLIVSPLRAAAWADANLLLEWANDGATRQASFSSAPIDRDAHHAWLKAILMDPERRLLLSPGGTVRLARTHTEAVVSITVAPAQRGQGEGRRLLTALTAWARAAGFAQRLVAWVRHDNPASRHLFSTAGYVRTHDNLIAGHPATCFVLDLMEMKETP